MKENKKLDKNVKIKNLKDNSSMPTIAKKGFSIVGIGASAGGLDPLLTFLGNVPKNSGLAFVIVQHMENKSKQILVNLLKTATTMKTEQVYDNIQIKPDCVYVIPPNKNMSIKNNTLHLFDYIEPHTLRMPIDFFFCSLANELKNRSIGVILSGMGKDGTLGLTEIKKNGGSIFVQEPSSAKFEDMPRSAIDAGLADIISDVKTMPSKIISYPGHKPCINMNDQDKTNNLNSYFDNIIALLRTHTGHDFSLYKRNTIQRRIERCMDIHKINDLATYVCFLKENPQELKLLFNEFLIGGYQFLS